MKYKSYILLILMCFLSVSLKAQIEHDIIRPSVNAEQFSFGLKAETALSKGQLSLNIPLVELKGKGYNLPVSLTFYNGDVTFRTEASSVGLGWALMAGGVITRTIKGNADSYDYSEHHTNGNYISDSFNNHRSFINDILVDPMPDEYTYSLPGHSGTIDVSVSSSGTVTRKLYPDESYRIEPTADGFCITADDGTRFYFEDAEERSVSENYRSTSWFLSRIETAIGGVFSFRYATEEYVDLSAVITDGVYYEKFCTKRIRWIESEFGTIYFDAETRSDRGGWGNSSITTGRASKRINRIRLVDEHNSFVKGFELDNSEYFTHSFAPTNTSWTDIRLKLSSVTQYDAAGNRLPPYVFEYSHKFGRSKLVVRPANVSQDEDYALDSWTSCNVEQAYVDLSDNGSPSCFLAYPNSPNSEPVGITMRCENLASTTADDHFCLTRVLYPNGSEEKFTYENHQYNSINGTDASQYHTDRIHGKRLASRVRRGTGVNQRTEYVYRLHDSDYSVLGTSSGVLTNPSIHCATYYTPQSELGGLKYIATRLMSQKALNTFMGPPVYYTEVEEIDKGINNVIDGDSIMNRTIHYFGLKRVAPPVNYIYINGGLGFNTPSLVEIGNTIYGTKTGYTYHMSFCNSRNMTYMAYPVGEFTHVIDTSEMPLKEVFIGNDGKVRCIREYTYHWDDNFTKFGYKVDSQDFYNSNDHTSYTIYRISKSEYITNRFRLDGINTTRYYHHQNSCDSTYETYRVNHHKGLVTFTSYTRGQDNKITRYYFPGDIANILGNNSTPELTAINGLIDRNIIADPIKTVIKRNNIIIGGECRDYQMDSDVPMLKSIYRMKNSTDNTNLDAAPAITNGNGVNYKADLYKEGEILTYDENHNPQHVRINGTQDRIYVWGYGGRFPVAVIDNMDYATYNSLTNLKNSIAGLSNIRKILYASGYDNLRSINQQIRQLLPASAQITTYTYDPYFGMTSEMDGSNLGTIYTYDTFGRLSARYDENYKKLEEYNYNLYLQQ